ncbi:MAG: hypothetical protein ABFD49_11810 [Armatimonadota bacterium]|nr:hypothetical protein [bacterium]
MQKPTIKSLELELKEIDSKICEAINSVDPDKAAQLEARKIVLPKIIDGMKEKAKELEAKVQTAEQWKQNADAAFKPIEEKNRKIAEELEKLHKLSKDLATEYVEAQGRVMSANGQLMQARNELRRLQG